MADDWQYKKSLMLLEEARYRDEKETLYGGPRRRMYKIKIGGMPVFVQDEVLDFLVKENGIKLPTKITCEKCTHKREENGVLRCPYSTVDLDPNGYCHRGMKKGKEEERVAPDEALWLIVKEAGFHDGVLYTTPMIACSECGVTALHEQSGGMGHGGPQISLRWLATHYCPNCGKEMKNWRSKHETESSGGGMPE